MYLYHASALGLGGKLTQPSNEIIDPQAAACLCSAGGQSTFSKDRFNSKGISFDSALVEVTGGPVVDAPDETHATTTKVTIAGLNILDVVTADKVVLHLESRHRLKDGPEPSITINNDSGFENLKISSHPIEVQDWVHETFRKYDTYKKFQDAFKRPDGKTAPANTSTGGATIATIKTAPADTGTGSTTIKTVPADTGNANVENAARQEILDCMMGCHLQTNGSDPKHLADVKKGFNKLQAADELSTPMLCSIVKTIRPLDTGANIAVQGPIIIVPDFGTVYLGEVVVMPGMRRVNMLRLELGSPKVGSITASSGESNGTAFPP